MYCCGNVGMAVVDVRKIVVVVIDPVSSGE
jgi:hypothetical protein